MRSHEEDRLTPQPTPPIPRRKDTARDPQAAFGAGRRGPLDAATVLHLQRTAGNASVAGMLTDEDPGAERRSPVKDVVGSGGGEPLDPSTRGFMEDRLGHDFSAVRVHTDAQATESARSVGAQAYTVGHDVVFQADRWSPGTADGRRMLAHELTHVVQQSAGPVEGTPAPGGIALSDPSDRFERDADATAAAAMQDPAPAPATTTAGSGAAGGPAVQRQAGDEPDEEETVQGSFVQRQAEAGEEPEEEVPG